MSQENLEIVRRAYERLGGGDIDGVLQLCTADLEFRDLPDLPGSGLFLGHDAFRAWYTQLIDAFEDLQFEAKGFSAAGAMVVVPTEATGRGRGSHAAVEMHFTSVWTLSDAKLVSHVAYSDHAAALAAVGLSE